MFVVRNSGNMVPHSNNYGNISLCLNVGGYVSLLILFKGPAGFEVSVTTEPAALELAVKRGKIKHVIVCGHSDCKVNTGFNVFKL